MNVENRVYEISKLISDAKEKNEELAKRVLTTALNSKYGKYSK
jgi:hypothetical protein